MVPIVKSRSLLINYVGIPTMLSSLMPDIGLALLSSCLRQQDHYTKILDYSSLETIRKLSPPSEVKKELDITVEALSGYFQNNEFPPQIRIDDYQAALKKVDKTKQIKLENIVDEIDGEVKKEHANFVGFKLWIGESFEGSIRIAEELKRRNPKLKIFAGGAQVDWFKEYIFDESDVFDALAYCEGDEIIGKLAEFSIGKSKLKDIPNIIYKDGAQIIRTEPKRTENLDELPFPNYCEENYPAMHSNNKLKVFMLEESRGCPNSCNFCIHPIKSGRRWRTKSAERIVDEMEDIIKKYNSKYFRFSGSNTPSKLQFEIAAEIIKRDIDVKYSSFGHMKEHKHADYELMKQAGCFALLFGLESGSYNIQKNVMNKVIKLDRAKEALSGCKDAGIKTAVSLIYPAPLETEKTRQETLEFIDEIKPNSVITSFPGIVLGTRWHREAERFKIGIDSQEKFIKDVMRYKARYSSHPSLWDPIPYTINGKNFKQIVAESGNFVNEFKKKGFLTQVTDEMLLLSYLSGMGDKEFAREVSLMLVENNVDKMQELVARINSRTESHNVWNDYAKIYDKLVPMTSFYREQLRRVESHLKDKQTILDLGCGSGRLVKKLAMKNKTCYGIDSNKDMFLSAVDDESRGIFFSLQDIQEMNFPAEFFDAVTSINSLYCVEDPEKVLNGVYGILKPSGLFILTGPKKGFDVKRVIDGARSEFESKGLFEKYKNDFEFIVQCNRKISSSGVKNCYSNKDIENLLLKLNFSHIRVSGSSYLDQNYFVVAEK